MGEEKYLDLIAKYLSGNIQSEEREILFSWVGHNPDNQKYFDEMIQLWSHPVSIDDDDFQPDIESAWNNIDLKISNPKTIQEPQTTTIVSLPKKRNSRWLLSIAASVAILITAAFLFKDILFPPSVPVTTILANQEKIKVELPDGSFVWLNKNSSISYDKDFDVRTVNFEGEGYFEIAKDASRPFTILSGAAKTTVLGTAFNLRAYPEEKDIELVVEEGKVKFESTKKETSIFLEKDESAIFNREDDTIKEKNITSKNIFAWKTGTISFSDTPILEVVSDLSRQFKVTFKLDIEESPCPFKSTYQGDVKLETILDDITEILNLQTKRSGDTYVISGRCPDAK